MLVAVAAVIACAVSCGVDVINGSSSSSGNVGDGGLKLDSTSDAFDNGPCVVPLCDDGHACDAGTICSPTVPTGWHVLAFGASSEPATTTSCGSSYTPFNPTIKVADAAATCTCTCAKTEDGTCTGTAINVSYGKGDCNNVLGTVVANNSCLSLPDSGFIATDAAGATFSLAMIPTAAIPKCAAAIVDADIPSLDAGQVRGCRPPNTSTTCERDHRLCIPAPPSGLKLCIASDLIVGGPTTCPSGFEAEPFHVATAAIDNRTCASCSCEPVPTTCTVSFELAQNCGGGGIELTQTDASSSCTIMTATEPGYKYGTFSVVGGSPGGSCRKSPDTQVAGEAGVTGYIVCCSK